MSYVVNCRTARYDVYIGRPSIWGNPFEMGEQYGTRAEVIALYKQWVVKQPDLMSRLHELEGKTLGCWCHPKACHGDVLADLANTTRLFT